MPMGELCTPCFNDVPQTTESAGNADGLQTGGGIHQRIRLAAQQLSSPQQQRPVNLCPLFSGWFGHPQRPQTGFQASYLHRQLSRRYLRKNTCS